jgi:DNA-binding IclR family transcriptional regulator
MSMTRIIPSSQGYLRPSILYHLMNEGTGTLEDLSRLIGRPRETIRRQLLVMQTLGQVQHATVGTGYSLSKVGIDAALLVRAHEVECA